MSEETVEVTKKRQSKKHKTLFEKAKQLISKDSNLMILAEENESYILILKKEVLNTVRFNENSIFQPHKFKETKEYAIAYLLLFNDKAKEKSLKEKFKKIGATVYMVPSIDRLVVDVLAVTN